MRTPLAATFAFVLLSVACSGPALVEDAGTDAADDAATLAPSDVAEAALPSMDCPAGWAASPLPGEGVEVCDPFGGPRALCSGMAAHFVGERDCRTIGTACPADGLPADVPADAVFVLAGVVSGDGTRAAPFATVGEAFAAVADGGTIAVGIGRYDEALRIDRPVTMRGECMESVLTHDRTALTLRADVDISNLRVEDAFIGAAVVTGMATLHDVALTSCATAAFVFSEGDLTMSDFLMRDIRDVAVSVSTASVRLERFAMENVGDAFSGSEVSATMSDGVVDGLSTDTGSFAAIFESGDVVIERVALRGEWLGEVIVNGSSSLVIRDLDARASGRSSEPHFGLSGIDGASIELSRVFLSGATTLGASISTPGSTLTMTDVIVHDMRPTPGFGGHGVEVGDGASATITRTLISGAVGLGVLASGSGTSALLEDVVVRSTAANATGAFGRALQAQLGASVISTRTRFSGNREASAVVTSGSTWNGTDAVIEDSEERTCASSGCPPGGIGLSVFDSGTATLERFRVHRSALVGVQVALDGSLTLFDGEITDCPIGANVQVSGYDLERLTERVLYRDNGVNLDASELSIPDPVVPPGG